MMAMMRNGSKGGRPRIRENKAQKGPDGADLFVSILRSVYTKQISNDMLPTVSIVPGMLTQGDLQPYLMDLPSGLDHSANSLALTRALERVVRVDQPRKRSDRASYTDAELTDAIRELIINNKAEVKKVEERFGVPFKTVERKLALIRMEINLHPSLINKPAKTLSQMRKVWATTDGRSIVKAAISAVGTVRLKSGPKQHFLDSEKVLIAQQTHAKSMNGEVTSRLDLAELAEEVIKQKGKRMASEAAAKGNAKMAKRAKKMEEAKMELHTKLILPSKHREGIFDKQLMSAPEQCPL